MFNQMKYQGILNKAINTQSWCLTGATYSSYTEPPIRESDPKGVEVKKLLYKAYEAIHRYENFHNGTNRRSELNDRMDQVKEWMISQWPDIYGSMGVSGTGAAMSGLSSAMGSLQGAMSGLGSSMAGAAVGMTNPYNQIQQQVIKATLGEKDSTYTII